MTQFRKASGWVVTSGCDHQYKPLASVTWPVWQRYASENGAAWWGHHWTKDPNLFGVSWCRIWNILECLDRGYEYVFCVDTDSVPVRGWVGDDLSGDYALWMAREHWDGHVFPSAGLMVIRNCDDAIEILHEVWAKRFKYAKDPWQEQAAIYELMGVENVKHPSERTKTLPFAGPWSHRIGFLPRDTMWTPKDQIEDPKIIHATGVPFLTRLSILTDAVAEHGPRCGR